MRRRSMKGRRWAIILAGGEGTRLSEFVFDRLGERRPKQYCRLLGERSMLEHTIGRARRLVDQLDDACGLPVQSPW